MAGKERGGALEELAAAPAKEGAAAQAAVGAAARAAARSGEVLSAWNEASEGLRGELDGEMQRARLAGFEVELALLGIPQERVGALVSNALTTCLWTAPHLPPWTI